MLLLIATICGLALRRKWGILQQIKEKKIAQKCPYPSSICMYWAVCASNICAVSEIWCEPPTVWTHHCWVPTKNQLASSRSQAYCHSQPQWPHLGNPWNISQEFLQHYELRKLYTLRSNGKHFRFTSALFSSKKCQNVPVTSGTAS